MSIPDNYPDPFEWAVECEQRAEKAEAENKMLRDAIQRHKSAILKTVQNK